MNKVTRALQRMSREAKSRAIKSMSTSDAAQLAQAEITRLNESIREDRLVIEELTATSTRLKKDNPDDVETLQTIAGKVSDRKRQIAEAEISIAEQRARMRLLSSK